jgi:arabinogalactan oligomer/maltooligosaccharide transport system permease protein
MFAAGAVLVAVPITILYLFLQRYLIEGLSAGANKE